MIIELYKYVVPYNRHLRRIISKHIYACARSLVLKISFCEINIFLMSINKPIQTKVIPSSESTFKIKEKLDRTLFLISLTLAVNIQIYFSIKVGLVFIFLFCIFFVFISFHKLCILFENLECLVHYAADI